MVTFVIMSNAKSKCYSSCVSIVRNQNITSNREKLLEDSKNVVDKSNYVKKKIRVKSSDRENDATKFIVISKARNECVATKRCPTIENSSHSEIDLRPKSKKVDPRIANCSTKPISRKGRNHLGMDKNSVMHFASTDLKLKGKTNNRSTNNSSVASSNENKLKLKIRAHSCQTNDSLVSATLKLNNSILVGKTNDCSSSVNLRRIKYSRTESTNSSSRQGIRSSNISERQPNDAATKLKLCHLHSDMPRQHEINAFYKRRLNTFLGQSYSPENRKCFYNKTSFHRRTPAHNCCRKSERSFDTSVNNYLSDGCDNGIIDYELIKQCLKLSPSPIKKFDVLQSIRLRITNQVSLERRNTVQDIVYNDLFDIRSECGVSGLLKNLLWPINISTSHPLQSSTVKLLNTIVSYQIGREYFNNISIVHLLTWSNREIVDETMGDNLIAVMMKLSLNQFQRFDMVEKGLLQWLGKHMEDVEHSTSTYRLECITDLLRILVSVLNPIAFPSHDVLQLVSVLVRYLKKKNALAKLNICRTLRALFQNRKAIVMAKNLCLQEIIEDLIEKVSDSIEMEHFQVIYGLLSISKPHVSNEKRKVTLPVDKQHKISNGGQQLNLNSTKHSENDPHTNRYESIENMRYTQTFQENSVPSKRKDRGIPRRLRSRRKVDKSLRLNNSNKLDATECNDGLQLQCKLAVEGRITSKSKMTRSVSEPLINDKNKIEVEYGVITKNETKKNQNKGLNRDDESNDSIKSISIKHAHKPKRSTREKCEDIILQKDFSTLVESAEDVEYTTHEDEGNNERETARMTDALKSSSQQSAAICEQVISDNNLDAANKSSPQDSINLSEQILDEAMNTDQKYAQDSSNKKINYSDLISETYDPDIRKDILENESIIDELCKKIFLKLQRENMFCGPNCNSYGGINSCTNNEVQNEESA